ncbi:MAG: gluconeogenesis factor YvcK family protein [Candidatus Dojkabacteria bacterium]
MENIVVVGGGTGTFTVLRGLKNYPQTNLSAIVTMTDDGGSTGRLRDEFGVLPLGDVRQCLIALAKEDEASRILRELFIYRFPKSESSENGGHNFGNLFLTALTDILGSEAEAIEAAAEVLNVRGKIYPVTEEDVQLAAQYSDGNVLIGESKIDEPNCEKHDCRTRVIKLWTQPEAQLNPEAKEAILQADKIVIGPGDLYSSLLSNVVIKGVPEAIGESKAKFIYVTNLVSKYGQTHGMSQSDYVAEIAKYTKRKPDTILVNNAEADEDILAKYARENSFPVQDDLGEAANVVRKDLLSEEKIEREKNDAIKRSLLRHDSDKLASAIIAI